MSSKRLPNFRRTVSLDASAQKRRTPFRYGRLVLAALGLACFLTSALAQEDDTTNTAPSAVTETNNQEILRAYLQLQEQLHLTQLAIEQNHKETRETAAQSAEALAARLHSIEQALESQRNRELETMQSSNRVLLIVAGTFAGIGFLAMLLTSFFQWRTVNRLALLPTSPPTLAIGAGPPRPELGQVVSLGAAEQSSLRLLDAVEQLEKRLNQMEHASRAPLNENPSAGAVITNGPANPGGNGGSLAHSTGASAASPNTERLSVLLGKGQSMLSLDDAQAAVSCFDEALAIDPQNAEAWVRKGTALEHLQQLDRAIECYDRAIQVDGSLTIAYLHKGGLFNRLERFNEALECYEKALRTQQARQAS